ncbi:putative exocyst complex component sec8 [Neurospora crassa OR74A] [Rhizoctonia solani]|uniref:Exocyst complex component Sec8 n=1 Tax=Rhizoctonia solani TaxID=456999 RepID=A0A0K6FQM4_9AGAM|nr:putative exocyst complex component sec8 [Neurospora crassa OR74A] [Rhizoctonia solani]
MSRTPRTRSSRSRDRGSEDFSRSNGYPYEAPPLPITRPLQPRPRVPSISGGYTSDRDRERFGTSPSGSRMHYETPSRASPAPSRPARSDRRPINSIASDSFRQGHSPRPSMDDDVDPYGGMDAPPLAQPQFQEDYGEPRALGTVISAFQMAGNRRGSIPDRDRERVIEQRDRIREREPGRAIRGRRGTIGEIDAVLDQMQEEWAFVIDPDFNPVSLALALLDESSVGRDLDSFRRTKAMLERALKGTVDKHYQAFAASLPHHNKLISLLSDTQKHIAETRACLTDARAALSHQRADLVQLWSRGQTIEEMLRILDEIERLKNIPDQLESLMSEKKLLQAALLLVRSQKTITGAEIMEIGALTDLRSYLNGQETALRDIMIEELHAHLYLKSFWCEARWAAYKPGQELLPDLYPSSSSNDELPNISSSNTMPRALAKYLTDLKMRPATDVSFSTPDDPRQSVIDPTPSRTHSRNPSLSAGPSSMVDPTNTVKTPDNIESDSFLYIEMLLEALAVLGALGGALDAVNQRLGIEIFTLVEGVISDVHERAEFVRRGLEQSHPGAGSTGSGGGIYVFVGEGPGALRLAALEGAAKKADHEILRDMCWTLYSKLDAVVQGLRVVSEVSERIASRRDFKDTSGSNPGQLFPLANAWSSIRSEVRNLLHEHITDEGSGTTAGRNPISSINEILRTGKFGRDKSKGAFHFADTDSKPVNRALRAHEEGITQVLRSTVPGLITSLAGEPSAGAQFTTGPDASEHRLLVRPDAFHVSVLFQPTLAFLERAAACLPDGVAEGVGETGGGSLFLDDFVVRVYLPQLEEKVSNLFHQAVGGLDAFQEDTHSGRISEQPLVKASMQLMALINSLCIMLQATPLHRENYARLILGVIIQFYQRCYERFLDLVSRSAFSGEISSIAATWAQRPEVAACLGELYSTPLHEISQRRTLCKQETRVELTFLANAIVEKDDLLPHVRDLTALGSLYRSLTWFITQLLSMRLTLDDAPFATNDARASPKPPPSPKSPRQPPSSPFSPRIPLELIQSSSLSSDSVRLPLSRAMAQRFNAIMKTYDQLAELTLSTIRIDVRCRVMHYLHTGIQLENYRIDQECREPDPFVQDLNANLVACDDAINGVLPEIERRFIFDGIGGLVEHLLVSNSRLIRFANNFGIQKMLRNLSALRQNLKTITGLPEDSELSQAQAYYNLFNLGPTAMLERIRNNQVFGFEEYKSMLNLQCGVDQALADNVRLSGLPHQTSDREYNDYLIELHALAIDDWS